MSPFFGGWCKIWTCSCETTAMLWAKRLPFLVALFHCKSHHSRELHREDAVFKITHEIREGSSLCLGTDMKSLRGNRICKRLSVSVLTDLASRAGVLAFPKAGTTTLSPTVDAHPLTLSYGVQSVCPRLL